MSMVIIFLVVLACIACLPASIAERKGKSFATWYIYGFFLWIIAVIHAISLPEPEKSKISYEKETLHQLVKVGKKSFSTVDINALAYINDYEIIKNESGDIFFDCKIRNVTENVIQAVKIKAVAYNSFDEIISIDDSDSFDIIVQDLYITPGEELKINKPVALHNELIRKLDLTITQISYNDGTIENTKEPIFVDANQNFLQNPYLKMAIRENRDAKCYMINADTYWQCICGYVNNTSRRICLNCGMYKKYAENYTVENIEESYNDFLEAEVQREERAKRSAEQEELKKQNEKKKIYIMIGIAIVCVILWQFK